MLGTNGNPFIAIEIAGSKTSLSFFVPYFNNKSIQASKAPGTKMKEDSYIGSYMHSELAGKKVSNPSLVKYYGPLLKGFKS